LEAIPNARDAPMKTTPGSQFLNSNIKTAFGEILAIEYQVPTFPLFSEQEAERGRKGWFIR
jgi:hypothetical protein